MKPNSQKLSLSKRVRAKCVYVLFTAIDESVRASFDFEDIDNNSDEREAYNILLRIQEMCRNNIKKSLPTLLLPELQDIIADYVGISTDPETWIYQGD